MSEDRTRELPKESSFEVRVLAEFSAIRGELGIVRGEQVEIRGELAAIRVEQVEIRGELAAIRVEQVEIRGELAAIRVEQTAIRTDIARLDSRQQKFDERLTALEEKVDERLRETRPIWESVQLAIERLEMKFDRVILELYELRTDLGMLDKRLLKLEAG